LVLPDRVVVRLTFHCPSRWLNSTSQVALVEAVLMIPSMVLERVTP